MMKFIVGVQRTAILILAALAISESPANAQVCPAVGADTDCGIVVTITDTGSSVSFTGQGPFDTIEDTLVGIVNNSSRAIHSIGLRSALPIFGFDGDGICGTSPITGLPYSPVPSGCPFGPTTYEGPGVSFANINSSLTSGTVNFTTPLAAGGGTGYFSLEEAISAAFSCPDVVNNSVTHSVSGVTTITATFTPNFGLSLQQAAQFCGVVDFDWQQTITSLPLPSPFFQIGNPNPLSAPPPFLDPPPGGYTYQLPNGDHSFPFYYDPNSGELASHETTNVLSFSDTPADPCLPGGNSIGVQGCNGSNAPAGSSLGFTTHLAGVLADGTAVDLGIGFNWTSTFNGTSGGVATTKNDRPVDPGSGTGGITITGVQNVTDYQYNGIVVTTVNGTPTSGAGGADTTPPVITVSATPSMLWPPNNKMVPVTVSGTITDNESGGTGVNPSTASFAVTDEYGQVQPTGSVVLGSDGSYSFTIQLHASRNGDDIDGRQYIITVSAEDNAGNKGSSSTGVIVSHDQRH